MKHKRDVCGILLVCVSAVLSLLSVYTLFSDRVVSWMLTKFYNVTNMESSTIGVIGGADGPTAIFVTTVKSPGSDWVIYLSTVLAIGVTIWHFVRKRKKK